jgi:pSer/pThr/pTyr-binding forkhead associated (FHA) protein
MIRISVYYEDSAVTEFEQADPSKEVTIGRAPGCSIHLEEASISRLHALIRFQNGMWMLERKANFGAVLLNGQEVENAPLEGGEEISIGKFSLRVNIEEPAVAHPTKSMVADPGMYEEDGDGRTRIVSSGVNALFQFEPGSANVGQFLMEADVAVFGRGSNCDVVLTEKKASRKHLEIRKQGLSFFLKDLNSANGTLVNGSRVDEVELVAGDVIEVGESKIQFSVENKDYFSRQDQFMPVPAQLQQSAGVYGEGAGPLDPGGALYDPNAPVDGAIPGMDGTGAPEPEPKSLVEKLKRKYSSMPRAQRLRLITILVVFALVSALLGGPDEAPRKARPRTKAGDKAVRTIDQLTAKHRKFVIDNYNLLIKAHEARDFAKMMDHTSKILTYVDVYKDTKSYESIAKKGLEEIEEAKARRALEEKQAQIRKEVAALEEKARAVFERALENPKYRPELEAMIKEIYVKDPNNQLAAQWRQQIKDKEEQEKQEAEIARQREEQKAKAEASLADVQKIFKEEKYIEALAAADKLLELGWDEDGYVERVEKLKTEIRGKLDSILGPLLREAAQQREEGGDLVKAKERYLDVLKIDKRHPEAKAGLDAIRETLHLRAKRFYAEAILAESVSDLVEAKDKFEKCLRAAPEGDIYKGRCRNKLARFDAFTGGSNANY